MNILKTILAEQRAFDYQKVITDAIKNRRKISFYYNGPQRPEKIRVKPGRRILVDPTTLGLTKKGNLAFKGYVKPPSVTKTGFEKHGWRTFLLNRIHRLELTDDTYDQEPPGYKPANNDSTFSKIYVQTDFSKKPRINKYDQPVYTRLGRRPIDKTKEPEKPELAPPKPELEPEKPELELPKPEEKPIPKPEVGGIEKPEVEPQPGQEELPQPKVKEKPPVNPEGFEDEDEEEKSQLYEQIDKIKSLMFRIKVL